jgi:CubicO group peptidase (beta-lactamase class C family)
MRTRVLVISTTIALALVGERPSAAPPLNGTGPDPRAQSAQTRPAIDAVFADWDRRDSPGCAVGLYENGRIAYARGYGMADLEHDVPIAPESVFYVGSLSKQFTAMAAALAMDQGKLALDDRIRTYLPELPEYTSAITVRHLLHHTSGLRDYNTLLSIAGRRGDEAYDNPTVLRITARQKQLNFAPGDEYLYSNTGYTLLALIVERATGTPFSEFAARNIFAPLDMTVTHYHTDDSRLVKARASAYGGRVGTFTLDTPRNERAGAGGVFTSVRDLLRWDENFYTTRVGGRALIDRLQTRGTLNNGTVLNYAWGLELGTYRGLRIVEHGGSLGGYRAHLLRFPDQHESVAILCNLGSINPGALARRVADVSLASNFTAPAEASRGEAPASVDGSSGGPSRAARDDAGAARPEPGRYYSDEVDATIIVETNNGRATARRDNGEAAVVLQPTERGAFRFRGMTLRFEHGAAGAAALVIDAGRVRDIRFVRQMNERQ